jgi:uncharacterized membrane protein YuzA (DUF378 family)
MKERELGWLRGLDVITAVFLVIGGVTMGIGGIVGFEALMTFLGSFGIVARIFAVIIGLCAIYEASMWRAIPRRWCSTFSETPHGATSS